MDGKPSVPRIRCFDLSASCTTLVHGPVAFSQVQATATGRLPGENSDVIFTATWEPFARTLEIRRTQPESTCPGALVYGPAVDAEVGGLAFGGPDDDGNDSLFAAIDVGHGPQIFRWDDPTMGPPTVSSPSPGLTARALTTLDMHGQGDSALYIGFERPDGAALVVRDEDGEPAGGFDQILYAGRTY